MNALGSLPLVWESMAVVGGELAIAFQCRYMTRAAALHGHRQILATIQDQQRARRYAQRTTAPRRPATRGGRA